MTRQDSKIPNQSSLWGKQAVDFNVIRFLQGPERQRIELTRLFRVFTEFIRGFRALRTVGPCVTVFGSARYGHEHPYYQLAQKMGNELP